MKRFEWRLQRVLDIKKKEEQKKQSELLLITEKLAQARGELMMQKGILEEIIEDLARENTESRMNKQEFFIRNSSASDELIRKLEGKVSELEISQREKRDELLSIKRFNKGLEKLRAEAKTQFIKEQDKLEQKEADEMTTIRFARTIAEIESLKVKAES